MNKSSQWLNDFLTTLITKDIINSKENLQSINSYPLLNIEPSSWGYVTKIATVNKYRFAGIWAQNLQGKFQINALFEYLGSYLLLRTIIATSYKIHSIAQYYPAANRLERHMRDMFGVKFTDQPDLRRWTRHKAWKENEFPLRENFPLNPENPQLTPPDCEYPFQKVHGEGVYEIPVGPIHAGIIEPGHLRFHANGEDVLLLEERLGYVHKGIEKLAVGRDIDELIKLASRVSGDSTVAYAWATARAFEESYSIEIPKRAAFLRGILAERERIANHLGDFAAICNDVGFSFAYSQLMRLKELWLRQNALLFGHRLLMDCITSRGVKVDLDKQQKKNLHQEINILTEELKEIFPILEENSSLHDRLKTTGKLSLEMAHTLGVLGYVGRASSCKFDLRHDAPYPPYDQLQIKVPVYNHGDVLARLRIRAQEILSSLKILNSLLLKMPEGTIETKWQTPKKSAEGIGLIEGWRGEILVYVSFTDNGLVERFFPRDPSWFSWLALEELIYGNIVPDFPVCNKSINGSYSGVDL
ncbi:MAG: hydrogenase [Gammaproteobacteria bacterium GWE2_37_16]|nr:MAG: hydrogenase [Gammaproteobacteria bacterium GWE2_37_16]